jgi:predicted metal-binding membrane protein
MDNEMIITVSAIVASYVAVFKAFKLVDTKYLPLVSIAIATIFVLVPINIYNNLVLISTIGLGAAGMYHMTKSKGDSSK